MRVRAWIFGQWQRPLNLSLFVGLICLGNLIIYQKPLLTHAISVADLPNALGYLQLISLQLLQLLLLAFFLFLAATISTRLLKAIASIIALTNAAALYFMLAYKMELDGTMIANILNTDTSEAAGLWSAAILPYLFFFGVIPTILIWKTKVTRPRRIWRFAAGVGSLVVLIGWLFATAHTWAWYDQNGTRLGAKILPWSYIVNTARHYNQQALNSREQVLLPLATFDRPILRAKKSLCWSSENPRVPRISRPMAMGATPTNSRKKRRWWHCQSGNHVQPIRFRPRRAF